MAGAAKRHHYVAQMHLRRFTANPLDPAPTLYTLDVRSGKTGRAPVRDVAVIGQYNRLNPIAGVDPAFVENLFSALEGKVAQIFEAIVNGTALTDQQRVHLAFFMVLQYHRTPRGRERTLWFMERAGSAWAAQQLLEEAGKTAQADSASAFQKAADALLNGTIKATPGWNGEVLGMFAVVDTVPLMLLENMVWTVMRAQGDDQFIICDDPVHIWDPDSPLDRSGGWMSSPRVNTTMPVDPGVCLLLQPGPGLWRDVAVDSAAVRDLNLKTYASAERQIYGPRQGLLQTVRTAAKANPDLVASFRTRPPSIVILDTTEGSDEPGKVEVMKGPARPTIRRYREKPLAKNGGSANSGSKGN
jgi:hypothetical protein